MAVKKSSAKKKYGAGALQQVETELHEMKRGQLKSGRSGKKVTNPKQAIAIALSEARRAGKKVPPPPTKSTAVKKTNTKKAAAKKAQGRKSAAKKSGTKKAAMKNGKINRKKKKPGASAGLLYRKLN